MRTVIQHHLAPSGRGRAAAAIAFTRAAPIYWCSVYPEICADVARRRRRAEAIPDSSLRRAALSALASKRMNVDGAAAYACFVPAGARRAAAIRAQLAFQSIYDYLDVLTEQPHADPIESSRTLHNALLAALRPRACGSDGFYDVLRAGGADDGGYLRQMVQSCGAALGELPSYATVRASAERLTRHIVDYQSFNVGDGAPQRRALSGWARQATPADASVSWWETAAAAGSSLGLFALIAIAARPEVGAAQALAIEHAYFPWIGALHSLLDGLIDLPEDLASGQQTLIGHYGDAEQIAAGLHRLAREARRRAATLPDAEIHLAILAAMASIYLAEPASRAPHARRARAEVLAAIGGLSAPAMAVMRLRRLAGA